MILMYNCSKIKNFVDNKGHKEYCRTVFDVTTSNIIKYLSLIQSGGV